MRASLYKKTFKENSKNCMTYFIYASEFNFTLQKILSKPTYRDLLKYAVSFLCFSFEKEILK